MELRFETKTFAELTTGVLYEMMRLRQEVFIVEQDCPYLDADGKDQMSWHLLGWGEDILQAYARIVPRGVSYESQASIGRVITGQHIRGKGLGKILMLKAIEVAKLKCPDEDIKISAQVQAQPFYKNLGFEEIGSEYLEDDIPHIAMLLKC